MKEEIARLKELEVEASTAPESDVDARTSDQLRDAALYYKDMSKEQ